jgi:hypothetical protein
MPGKLNLVGQRFGLAENHEAEPVRQGRRQPRKEAVAGREGCNKDRQSKAVNRRTSHRQAPQKTHH